MKKLLFVVAVATLFFSCQKEIEPTTPSSGERFTFKASIENLIASTKATIDKNNKLVWAKNDKIGVYVDESDWTQKNQSFTQKGECLCSPPDREQQRRRSDLENLRGQKSRDRFLRSQSRRSACKAYREVRDLRKDRQTNA